MLGDTERKILRIVNNIMIARNRPPSIQVIANKSGRSPQVVEKALQVLNDKRFILWSPEHHEQLQVVQAWEDHQLSRLPQKQEPVNKWWEYETNPGK